MFCVRMSLKLFNKINRRKRLNTMENFLLNATKEGGFKYHFCESYLIQISKIIYLMKRISTLLFTLAVFSTSLFSQSLSKFNFALTRMMKKEALQNKEIAVLVRGNIQEIKQKTEELGGVFKYSAGDIAAIRLPLNKVKEIANLKSVQRMESSDQKLQLMNDRMVVMNHVLPVQQGFNLPQGYDGTHVVMGIIDEGIDFTHPDFRDMNGNTRIKSVWDQRFGPTSLSPQPYGYGKQWIGSQIDTSTTFTDGQFSHGSHVAGTACGNGLAVNNYKGVASNADIVVVKMDIVNQTDDNFMTALVDAVNYIFSEAAVLQEPAVINISLGTYFGSHDGKDMQSLLINNLLDTIGRSVVCAAGNAGAAPIHIGYDVTGDTSFTWMQAPYSPLTNNQIYMELWGDSASFTNVQFALGIDRVLPDFSYLAEIPFSTIQTNLGPSNTYTLTSGGNRLGVIETQGEYINGSYKMMFLIEPDSANINYRWRLMTKGSGHLDGWCFDMVADNLPDSTVFPFVTKYKYPDLNQNIASGFTCSDHVITVGSYVNRNSYSNVQFSQTTDSTLIPGKLSISSSHGPTRDGRIKPDINATGEWVLSCGSYQFLTQEIANEPWKVAAGGKHFRSTGTSMSSPVVAGIAALYLQKNPTATYADVKNAILSCADNDAFTGNSLPNNHWGYGKVNAYSVIHGCGVGINDPDMSGVELKNYPNPFTDETAIQYDFSGLSKYRKAELKVRDVLGHDVLSFSLNDRSNTLVLSKDKLESGVYFYSVVIDGKILRTNKLVVL